MKNILIVSLMLVGCGKPEPTVVDQEKQLATICQSMQDGYQKTLDNPKTGGVDMFNAIKDKNLNKVFCGGLKYQLSQK